MPKICEDCGATARKKVQVNDKTTLYCNDCFEKSHEKVDDIELKTMQSVDKPNEKSSDKKGGGVSRMTVPSTKLNKDRPMPAAPDRDFGEGKILWLQFKSLMAKSLRIQGRQYVTNTVQVLLPMIVIMLLYLLQLLVTSTIQDQFGVYQPAQPRPSVEQPILYIPLEFEEGGCNNSIIKIEAIPYRFLSSGQDAGDLPAPREETLKLYNSLFGGLAGAQRSSSSNDTDPFSQFGQMNNNDNENAANSMSDMMSMSGMMSSSANAMMDETAGALGGLAALLGGGGSGGNGILGELSQNPLDWIGNRAFAFLTRGGQTTTCLTFLTLGVPKVDVLDSLKDQEEEILSGWGDYNRTAIAGIDWEEIELGGSNPKVRFSVLYNQTLTKGRDVSPIVNRFVSAIFKYVTNDTTSTLTYTGIAGYPTDRTENDFDLQSLLGPALFIYVFQLLFPVFLSSLVQEKEVGLTAIMKMMGLAGAVFSAVTYLFYLILYIIATALVIGLAAILEFRYFTENSTGVIILFFFVWGNTLIAWAFLMAQFFRKSRTAVIIGYIIVILSGVLAGQLVRNYFQSEDTPAAVNGLLMIVPPFALYRGLLDLSLFTTFGGTGILWEDVVGDGAAVGMRAALIALSIEWFVFLLLAYYLGRVLPSAGGVPAHPLFFIPRKWRGVREASKKDIISDMLQARGDEPTDVQRERMKTEQFAHKDNAESSVVPTDLANAQNYGSDKNDKTPAVRIYNLRKVYNGLDGKDFVAVNGLSLSLNLGQCYGFLGPNGAGKTTVINMLCGVTTPTFGNAFIENLSIRDDMNAIHRRMGVCPQANVLWPDLTADEHLRFYGTLKGLTGDLLDEHVDYWLEQVDLVGARNKRSKQYSGGMKRRLCVGISLIGSPEVVLLDEPSASLDPASRQRLWHVIEKHKKSCVMLLTTHSMQEAEELCDRVGIFVRGRLRTIGTPDELKTRYGAFYKVTLTTNGEKEEDQRAAQLLRRVAPSASLIHSLAGTNDFEVKRSDVKLSVLYKTLSAAMKDKHISNWSIVNTSLEEVFLRIIVNDEKGGNGDFSSGDDADDDVVINMRESIPAIEYDLSSSDDDRDVIVKAMSRRSVASPRTPLGDAKMKEFQSVRDLRHDTNSTSSDESQSSTEEYDLRSEEFSSSSTPRRARPTSNQALSPRKLSTRNKSLRLLDTEANDDETQFAVVLDEDGTIASSSDEEFYPITVVDSEDSFN